MRRGDIAIPELPREQVEVPEIGGAVTVRGLLLSQWSRVYLEIADDDGKVDPGKYSLALLAHCVVDDDGKPLLTLDEWDRLGTGLTRPAVLRLAESCRRVVGDNREEVEGNSTGLESERG